MKYIAAAAEAQKSLQDRERARQAELSTLDDFLAQLQDQAGTGTGTGAAAAGAVDGGGAGGGAAAATEAPLVVRWVRRTVRKKEPKPAPAQQPVEVTQEPSSSSSQTQHEEEEEREMVWNHLTRTYVPKSIGNVDSWRD
jgi:hypothetical protein